MRRALTIGAALVAALLVLLVMTTVAFAAPSPFTGAWWSEDIYDGSYQQMAIGGGPGNGHHVVYRDNVASLFQGHPAAMAKGTLLAEDNELYGTLPVWSLNRPKAYEGNFGFEFTYHQATDTLTDAWGGTWFRK